MVLRVASSVALLLWISVALADGPRASAALGDIDTLAGGGVGDGGGLADAAVAPYGVAVAASGDVYVADAENCRIRLISGGVISTVAGTGVCGYDGDGAVATAKRLNYPQAVALDFSGNVYIADTNNCRIRRVAAGQITTVAGAGICTMNGDGGPATAAQLQYPRGIAVDSSGNLFIADTDNCRIRKVTAGTINTLAGNGACGYGGDGGPATSASVSHPASVVVSGSGNVYFADTANCRVRFVGVSGIIGTLAGTGVCGYGGDGGPAASAQISQAAGIAFDPATAIVYIADTDNCRIRAVDTGLIDVVAGSASCGDSGDGGAATSASLQGPGAVAILGATLYVADTGNCRLRVVTAGTIDAVAGTGDCNYGGDGGPVLDARFSNPGGVAATLSGVVYVADTENCRIRSISAGVVATVAGTGVCGYGGDGGSPGAALLNAPAGIALSTSGDVYIADTQNCRVRRISGAAITTVAGNGACGYTGDGVGATTTALSYPESIAVGASGDLYIADTANCRIRRVVAGTITTVGGDGACTYDGDNGLATSASINFPRGVALGPGGYVFIADTQNCRIRRISGGNMTTFAGNGVCTHGGDGGAPGSASLAYPAGITVGADGTIYASTTGDCRVRVFTTPLADTIAGSGLCAFGGDGGAATLAQLDGPVGLALTGACGSLYIADRANARIRAVSIGGGDADCDGLLDAADNCPSIANPGQENNDRNFTELGGYGKVYDDVTVAHSDTVGDACDTDDDNDGLADTVETGGPPCGSATAASLPLNADTDGDRVLDGAECTLGSNPSNASSFPPTTVAPDADLDGVPDWADPNDASNDSDGDKVLDTVEYRGFNTNLSSTNTDGDSCGDAREIASINADLSVNVIDLNQVAVASGPSTSPAYIVYFDVNRSGSINVIDLFWVAQRFGSCS